MNLVRRSFNPFDVLPLLLTPSVSAVDREESRGVPLDIKATDSELTVVAALPGFRRDEITATIDGGVLTIKAQHVADAEDAAADAKATEADGAAVAEATKAPDATYLRREIHASRSAERSVRLPRTLDAKKASSTFADGILTLTIPRSESSKPVQVKIA